MHPFRLRRAFGALASVLAVATLASPARATTFRADTVTSISDGKGDVMDDHGNPVNQPRADVTAASVEYRPGEIAFTLTAPQGTDPRADANWNDGASSAIWLLDTNNDQNPDYAVALVNANGILAPGVVKPTDMNDVLCVGTGGFENSTYSAVISAACVGNPASFNWGGGIYYKADDGTVAIDGVPDADTLAGPITAPPVLDPAAGGYWFVGDDGGVFSFNAPFSGSTGAIKLNKPIVGMAADADHKGYWFVASDGGIFAFDAKFFGSTGAITLNKPVVGMAATPTGQGYWLVASDGGIFAFGDARFLGAVPATAKAPIVGMASSGTGSGYWFVAADGGVFSYGDAKYFGAATGSSFPVVGIAAARDGQGYSIVRADGSVVNRGSAPPAGSLAGRLPSHPIVGIAATL